MKNRSISWGFVISVFDTAEFDCIGKERKNVTFASTLNYTENYQSPLSNSKIQGDYDDVSYFGQSPRKLEPTRKANET